MSKQKCLDAIARMSQNTTTTANEPTFSEVLEYHIHAFPSISILISTSILLTLLTIYTPFTPRQRLMLRRFLTTALYTSMFTLLTIACQRSIEPDAERRLLDLDMALETGADKHGSLWCLWHIVVFLVACIWKPILWCLVGIAMVEVVCLAYCHSIDLTSTMNSAPWIKFRDRTQSRPNFVSRYIKKVGNLLGLPICGLRKTSTPRQFNFEGLPPELQIMVISNYIRDNLPSWITLASKPHKELAIFNALSNHSAVLADALKEYFRGTELEIDLDTYVTLEKNTFMNSYFHLFRRVSISLFGVQQSAFDVPVWNICYNRKLLSLGLACPYCKFAVEKKRALEKGLSELSYRHFANDSDDEDEANDEENKPSELRHLTFELCEWDIDHIFCGDLIRSWILDNKNVRTFTLKIRRMYRPAGSLVLAFSGKVNLLLDLKALLRVTPKVEVFQAKERNWWTRYMRPVFVYFRFHPLFDVGDEERITYEVDRSRFEDICHAYCSSMK